MGGLYLAIDSTAGERERGSLEALLSLPVARWSLVGGKVLATCVYMAISLALSLTAFVVVFRFVPLERIGMSANLGFSTALTFFIICLSFIPLGATLMTLVASFTRTYREAQTYLTTVLLVPTLPIAFASIYLLTELILMLSINLLDATTVVVAMGLLLDTSTMTGWYISWRRHKIRIFPALAFTCHFLYVVLFLLNCFFIPWGRVLGLVLNSAAIGLAALPTGFSWEEQQNKKTQDLPQFTNQVSPVASQQSGTVMQYMTQGQASSFPESYG